MLERLAFWVKFWGALLALVAGLGGIAWAGGGWVLDRQSQSLARIQHASIVAKLELAQKEAEARQTELVESLRELLLRQHAEVRQDIKDVHKRIDTVFRRVRDIE